MGRWGQLTQWALARFSVGVGRLGRPVLAWVLGGCGGPGRKRFDACAGTFASEGQRGARLARPRSRGSRDATMPAEFGDGDGM